MFPALACLMTFGAMDTQIDYSGLPSIVAYSDYKIVTEAVQATLDPSTVGSDLVDFNSTTVYRNVGAVGQVTITIPRYRQGDGAPDFPVTASWDNVSLDLKPSPIKAGFLQATASFVAQGTHALRIHFQEKAVKSGYANTQRKLEYQLNGSQPVGLFTMSFRYTNKTVFGAPKISPDLGWQSGPKGVAMRQENFEPGGRAAILEYYPFGF